MMLLVAYTVAAASPVGLGAVRDLTGSYDWVLWMLAATTLVGGAIGATLSPRWLRSARDRSGEPVVAAPG
jgi:cyanate permease